MDKVVIFIAVGAFLGWRIYRRTLRNIGRQKLRPTRAIIRLVLVGIATVVIFGVSLQFPRVLAGFGGGILGGALLGFFGLRLTKFETTEEGHFYTPDTRIGIAISALLAGRLLYRFYVLNQADYLASGHPPAMQSPLTFFIVGLTFGYSLVYYIGLFVHTHDRKPPEKIESPS